MYPVLELYGNVVSPHYVKDIFQKPSPFTDGEAELYILKQR